MDILEYRMIGSVLLLLGVSFIALGTGQIENVMEMLKHLKF